MKTLALLCLLLSSVLPPSCELPRRCSDLPVDDCELCDELAGCREKRGRWARCGPCPSGYDNVNGNGTLCENIDECGAGTDDCDPLTECTDTPGSYICSDCPPGWDDVSGDGTTCADFDECAAGADDCDPLAECTNTLGSYACGDCPPGYDDVSGDGTACTNIDECAAGNDDCAPGTLCVDTEGSYVCSGCGLGYEDVNGDGTVCVDIDECATGTDDCDPLASCTNTQGSFACECPVELDDVYGDATVCLDPSAPVPPGPAKFSATVFLRDTNTGGSATREAQDVALYYEDGEVGSLELTGQQWIRVDLPIQGDVLTEIHRYGDFNAEWRHWQGDCTARDMVRTGFPQLYTPGGIGSPLDSDLTLLDGTSVPAVRLRQFDLDDGVQLIVDRATGQPVRAIYIDSELQDGARDVLRQIDFTGGFDGSGAFDTDEVFRPAAWFDDAGSGSVCPDVDPTCYRADIVFLFDGSGSMAGPASGTTRWRWQVRLPEFFRGELDPTFDEVRMGYQVFRTKAFDESDKASDSSCCTEWAIESYGVSDEVNGRPWSLDSFFDDDALNSLNNDYPFTVGDTTNGGLVDGLRASFELLEDGRNRRFTRKAVVAFFDSAGSSPCTTPAELTLEDMDAGASWTDYLGDGTNCTAKHDAYVTALYDREFSTDTGFSPDVWAIGVSLGAPDVDSTVDLIARKGVNASTADVEALKYRIAYWNDAINVGDPPATRFADLRDALGYEYAMWNHPAGPGYCPSGFRVRSSCGCFVELGEFCCSTTGTCCSP